MPILAFGINHTTAPVDLREKTNFSNDMIPDALKKLTIQAGINEAAILSTCNRTEIYCALEPLQHDIPINWLSSYHGLTKQYLQPFIYTYPDAHAVKHILRVASGLDSMILGEPQILGQLKSAYQIGIHAGSIGKLLRQLFQYSFKVAKQVRTATAIGHHPISVAFASARLAQQIFGDLSKCTALLIGAGETIELVAKHLQENQISQMIIANRRIENAQRLINKHAAYAYAITLEDIPQHLAKADIVISSTASRTPILSKNTFESAIQTRKHKPIFVVDIAVPRDIEPKTDQLNDIYLYTVDDLQDVIQDNLKNRQKAAQQAEKIIATQVTNFMNWLNSLDAVPTICALRNQAQSIQAEVMASAQQQLSKGVNPEQVLQNATRTLTNKLMHSPSNQLRLAGSQGRKDLISAAYELFELDTDQSSQTK